jgi:hypothetical protein
MRSTPFVVGFILFCAQTIRCTASPSDLCREAALQAARDTDVPFAVLLAISQTETGRTIGGQVQPWAWAVNMEGAGHWFDSQAAALAFARERMAMGAESFDVGCFQLNHRWHGAAFPSLEAMIDPVSNARYAAEFLAELHRETGDWSAAAGAYHSRTPDLADRYRARFDPLYAALAAGDGTPAALLAAVPQQNAYPLLQAGAGTMAMGSLVPLGSGG